MLSFAVGKKGFYRKTKNLLKLLKDQMFHYHSELGKC